MSREQYLAQASDEEKHFLAAYDPSRFPITVVTVDAVVFAAGHVLLIKRGNYPYRGCWALPGGFMDPTESTAAAALRELTEEAGIEPEQVKWSDFVGVADHPERDPRGRAVSIVYAYSVQSTVEVFAGDDAVEARWFPFEEAGKMDLAFDHSAILQQASGMIGVQI